MDRVPVNSSNVATVGYNESRSMLEVEFRSGSVYQYFGVPIQDFHALSGGSVSVGRYLNTEIKPRYRCEQVA
jgi:KTSC domain